MDNETHAKKIRKQSEADKDLEKKKTKVEARNTSKHKYVTRRGLRL